MSDLAPSSTFVLEQLPTAVVCLDADGRIQLANATARQLFGCSDPEELIGMPIRTYVQFMRLGGSGQEECMRDDGSSFPLEYESAPGQTCGTIVTLRDVSQRAAAERRKDELISLVSHELRSL